jgi:malate/lactate dehydrogenase
LVGVPVKLGARGVEQITQIELTSDEDSALKKSAAAVKELTTSSVCETPAVKVFPFALPLRIPES